MPPISDTDIAHWRRWCRRSETPSVHARSIETRYRTPQIWHPPEPHQAIDLRIAWRLEDAWRSLPEPYRIAIRYQDCLQLPEPLLRRWIRRDLHVPWAAWPNLYRLARAAWEEAAQNDFDAAAQVGIRATPALAEIAPETGHGQWDEPT